MKDSPNNFYEQGIYTVIVSFVLILFVLLFVFFFDGVQNSSLNKQQSAITSESLQSGIKIVQDTAVFYANEYDKNYRAIMSQTIPGSYIVPCWGYLPLPPSSNPDKNPFSYIDNFQRAEIFGASFPEETPIEKFTVTDPDACKINTPNPPFKKSKRAFALVTPQSCGPLCPTRYTYEPIYVTYPHPTFCNPGEVVIKCVTRIMNKNVNDNLQEKITDSGQNPTVQTFWKDIKNNSAGNIVIDEEPVKGRNWVDFDCKSDNTAISVLPIINLRISLTGSFKPIFKSPYEASTSTKTITANSVGSVNLCPPK